MQAFPRAARVALKVALMVLLLSTGFPGDVEANAKDARRCADKRLKVVSKAVNDRLACHGRATRRGSVDPECLTRADAKLRDRWAQTDDRMTCPFEGDGVFDQARDSIDDFVDEVIGHKDLGLDPNAPKSDRLVFFLPLCQGPDDYIDTPSPLSPGVESWPLRCLPPASLPLLSPNEITTQTLGTPTAWGGFLDSFTPYDDTDFAAMFCKSAAYNTGLFGGWPPTLGALYGPPTFDLWLSTANSSPATRFTKYGGRYVLPSGTKVADDWSDLTDGALHHGIDEFIDGTPVPSEAVAWTATGGSGEATPHHCDNWSKPDTGVATSGLPASSTSAWTANEITSCSLPLVSASSVPAPLAGVYCVQQQGAAPPCQELSDGRCVGTCGAGLACARLERGGCGCRPGAP